MTDDTSTADRRPHPPKSPRRPNDDAMPPYTPGGVPEPEGPVPRSQEERRPPPPTYPPKQTP